MINAKKVHIIGIGGIGTSAIARYFLASGATVSGSDMHLSDLTKALMKEGALIKVGHFADNIPSDCDLVVFSTAVPATNVERVAAEGRGLIMTSYPDFLGELAKTKKTIAVSGTNGKSTTTAMIAKILIDAGMDPLVILGTQSPDLNHGNLHMGSGEWFVVEACEHMGNMLKIVPDIAVVTNIEEDHLDYYNDLYDIRDHFSRWAKSAKHLVILNENDTQSKMLAIHKPVLFSQVDFDVGVPGAFNRANAAAAQQVARVAGASDEIIEVALKAFSGTWRRFERVGEWKGADIYSDYAHHPTSVRGTIAAFKEKYPDRRLVICFEPHQFSRTEELFDDFVTSFKGTDLLIISEVYEVEGRNESQGVTSKDLVREIKEGGESGQVMHAEDLEKAEGLIREHVEKGDIIVIMGAGDIDLIARKLVG
jgi:UDP-N-acetylmuramate--alanine ligase